MNAESNGAWTKSSHELTLERLRADFQGYTHNELYAIWSNLHGLIPLDAHQKLDLEQWKIHAQEDGRHVQEGGFKVSRAIYGRALKAKRGTAKPKGKPRGRRSDAQNGEQFGSNGFSPRALELARNYDRASAVMEAALGKYQEALDLVAQLRDMDPLIMEGLAKEDERVGDLLRIQVSN